MSLPVDLAGLPDTVLGPLGKKTKSNGSESSPAVGGPWSAAADASSMHGMPLRIATTLTSCRPIVFISACTCWMSSSLKGDQ